MQFINTFQSKAGAHTNQILGVMQAFIVLHIIFSYFLAHVGPLPKGGQKIKGIRKELKQEKKKYFFL